MEHAGVDVTGKRMVPETTSNSKTIQDDTAWPGTTHPLINPLGEAISAPERYAYALKVLEEQLDQTYDSGEQSIIKGAAPAAMIGAPSGIWSVRWWQDIGAALFEDIQWFDMLYKPTERLWRSILSSQFLVRKLMKFMIRTGHKYVPWPVLYAGPPSMIGWHVFKDGTYYGRSLPPIDPGRVLSNWTPQELAQQLFERKQSRPESNNSSSLLFPWFAQWFVEQFFKTGTRFDPDIDDKDDEFDRTWSGNDIDLSHVYGDRRSRTKALRSNDAPGELKSQQLNGEEYPVFYRNLSKEEQAACPMHFPKEASPEQHEEFFALGHARHNLHPGTLLFATLFLREHNRICRALRNKNPKWTSDQLFETTRLILTALMLKMTVNDYIQHINPYKAFKFTFSPELTHKITGWQYSNRIVFEFNLLYRWHSLVPDNVVNETGAIRFEETRYDTKYLTSRGVTAVLQSAMRQPANAFGAFSTPKGLVHLDKVSIHHARKMHLDTFNNYRIRYGLPPLKSLDQLTKDPQVRKALGEAYDNDINNVEFYVGLVCERVKQGIFPRLLTTMVLAHAMKGIFGNPLCSPHLWKKETFGDFGWDLIQTTTLADFVLRNTKLDPQFLTKSDLFEVQSEDAAVMV